MHRLVLLALPFLAACGGVDPDVGARQDDIVDGWVDDEHRAVGLVGATEGDGYRFFCSGTLVGPTTILTAAHCLFDAEGRRITARRLVFAVDGRVFDVDASSVMRGYAPGSDGPWEDAAVMTIGRRPDVAPIPIAAAPPEPGALALVVGFGVTNAANGAGFGTRRAVAVALDVITERELLYSSNDGGPCFGDSGGPVVVDQRVVGVTSRGIGADCRGVDIAQRADVLAGWLRRKGDVCVDRCESR